MYHEAVKDGIRMVNHNDYTPTEYYPRCCVCGKETLVYRYSSSTQYLCAECREDESAKWKAAVQSETHDAKERRLLKAKKKIHSMGIDYDNRFASAFEKIEKCLHTQGWFQSTEEIIAAAVLIQSGIASKHQVQIGKYRVDFVLPFLKVILEIDGEAFHRKDTRAYELFRDSAIIAESGPGWEVVRVSGNYINHSAQSLGGVIKDKKRELDRIRAKYAGSIPPNQMYRRYITYKKKESGCPCG